MRRRSVLLLLSSTLVLFKPRAFAKSRGRKLMKQEVKTERAPQAIGP
jgi:hypothetical protein